MLLLVHQPQWPSTVQFVCFSFAVRPSSHATHSEPSRLTNWFGASPAHNKSHGQRKTLVHIARGVSGARTATLDAGLLVVRRHLAWLALFARARVARPPLRSQRLFEVRCPANRSGGLSRTDRRTIVAGSVVDVRVLPGLAGLACEPVGTVLLPHAIRAALPSTTQRKSATTIGSEAARAVALQKFARTRTRTSCDANRCWCGHRQRKE